MNLKSISTAVQLTFLVVIGVSADAEARCQKHVGVSIGGCGPCYQLVYVQPVYVQPVYVQPAYGAPMYVQPGYAPREPCYAYPAQPVTYSNFSFGMTWR